MDWNAIWQGIVSNALYGLLIFGGGGLIAYLRIKRPNFADPLRFGLLGAACIALILFALMGRGILVRPRLEITPGNIEENLKLWAEHLSITLEHQEISDRYFSYIARLHGGDPIEVFRAKEKPAYFQFSANMDFAPQHQVAFSKLDKAQQERVQQELTLEVARLRMGTIIASLVAPTGQIVQTKIMLQKAVPIENMSEATFGDSFDEMTRSLQLVRAAVTLDLMPPDNETKPKGEMKSKVETKSKISNN